MPLLCGHGIEAAPFRLRRGLRSKAFLFVVDAMLIRFCSSRRDDAYSPLAHRVGNEHQPAIGHPDQREAVFTIVFAVIGLINGKWVLEDLACRSMPGAVCRGFPIIPFEFVILHGNYYGFAV
jgi:hypothetical protein